jgi:hypothetical protein
LRNVVCKLVDEVPELLELDPELLDDVAAVALAPSVGAMIVGENPWMFITASSRKTNSC